VAFGSPVPAAFEAAARLEAEGIHLTVASARFAKPIDTDSLAEWLGAHPWLLMIEDHTAPAGFGSAVLEAAEAQGLDAWKIHRAAVPDAFIEHDTRAAQLAAAHLGADGIVERVRTLARRTM